MKGILSILFAGLLAGCSSTMPIAAIPEIGSHHVTVVSGTTNISVVYWTARGRNARLDAVNGGLMAMALGEWVGSGEETAGRKVLKNGTVNTDRVRAQLADAVKHQLARANLLAADAGATARLTVSIHAVGLEEVQKGFWTPVLGVDARLDRPDQSTWRTSIYATGSHLRTVNEFAAHPALYSADLQEAIEDAANQLVNGPIRQ
jgi:hypothetical protein